MHHGQLNEKGTSVLPGQSNLDGRHQWCFRYEGHPYHAERERITILEIKQIVGQEPDVAIAEVVDGRQVERPNDYIVDLSKDCSFKRVPEFVRG